MTALPKPKDGILDIHPYVGGEGRLAANMTPARLASNENPLGASPKAIAAYKQAASDLHRYPDGAVSDLRAGLAAKYNLDENRIVCGAGSDELISLLMRAYAGPGDEVLYSKHGFMMYGIAARVVGATPVTAEEKDMHTDVDALIAAATPKTKLVFIANPNNPTGSYLTKEELHRLRKGLPDQALLVVDSAYAEYATDVTDYENGQDMVDHFGNVVMLRTFSKIYGLAALRVGWGYFPQEVADVLNRVRGPFNVNTPAQVAALAALGDDDFVKQSVDHNNKWRAWLQEKLLSMGIVSQNSLGNFLLVAFGTQAERIRLDLKEKGIFIRQMGAHHLPEHLRVSIGVEEDNLRFIKALEEVLGQNT